MRKNQEKSVIEMEEVDFNYILSVVLNMQILMQDDNIRPDITLPSIRKMLRSVKKVMTKYEK